MTWLKSFGQLMYQSSVRVTSRMTSPSKRRLQRRMNTERVFTPMDKQPQLEYLWPMNRAILKIMLHSTEAKLVRIQLALEEKEREDNASIAEAHDAGQRLSEHYWQEAHALRQMKKSAEFFRDILLETIEEATRKS